MRSAPSKSCSFGLLDGTLCGKDPPPWEECQHLWVTGGEAKNNSERLCRSAVPPNKPVTPNTTGKLAELAKLFGNPCRIRRYHLTDYRSDKGFGMTESHPFPTRTNLTKVFYINLDGSPERREHMEKQLNTSGVPYERFSAVDAEDIAAGKWNWYYEENNITVCDTFIKEHQWASMACPLSHRLVWEKILKDDPGGTGVYLVLEDDAILPPDWPWFVEESLRYVPDDWTAVKLGIWGNVECKDMVNDVVALDTGPSVLVQPTDVHFQFYSGSTANLYSPISLPRLLDSMKLHNYCHHDDNLHSAGASRTYALAHPVIKIQHSFGSVRHRLDRISADFASTVFNSTSDAPSGLFELHTTSHNFGVTEPRPFVFLGLLLVTSGVVALCCLALRGLRPGSPSKSPLLLGRRRRQREGPEGRCVPQEGSARE